MSMSCLTTITQHALLLVKGPDARRFLQGQVTCDIEQLFAATETSEHANTLTGAHCTHKGRVVFTFRAFALDKETIALKLPKDNLENAMQALGKYIVFSKAELIDKTDEFSLIGIQGEALINELQQHFEHWPQATQEAAHTPQGDIVCIGEGLYELWLTKDEAQALAPLLSNYPSQAHSHWDYITLNQGISEVYQASSEQWTPHAIGLHEIAGGVSFDKGCYTGQEVVARMQYLGKLKSKVYLLEAPEAVELPTPASPLYTSNKTQSIGELICAGYDHTQPTPTSRLLASIKISAAESNDIYLDEMCQHPLNIVE